MSDLRDEIARAFIRREWDLGPGDDDWNPAPEELAAADAVLRVVGAALLDETIVDIASAAIPRDMTQHGIHARCATRDVLSAAWRVVTGSKDG